MGTGAVPLSSLDSRVPSLIERLRRVHQRMVDAALTGYGFDRMAELAAEEVGRGVAIVMPSIEVAVLWPGGHEGELDAIERFAAARISSEALEIPPAFELIVPVTFGEELVGSVGMLAGDRAAPPEATEFLHLAATASATAFALEAARERRADPARLISDVFAGNLDPDAAARGATAAGMNLGEGVVAYATEIRSSRPREAAAVVAEACPGALTEVMDDRLFALVPGGTATEALAKRLGAYGPTAISSSYAAATDIGRALREAELMLDVVSRDSKTAREIESGSGSEVYRLLFRVLASRPEEVLSFYEDTIAPVARYDQQYQGELVATLEAYLANDCNMNATARAIYAHRHTVAYRLERVKELTGLDSGATEDRERLGLGLKALRIVEPDLHR